jgi:hypothetical protein
MPWNRFLGSLKVEKFGLSMLGMTVNLFIHMWGGGVHSNLNSPQSTCNFVFTEICHPLIGKYKIRRNLYFSMTLSAPYQTY